MYFFKLIRNLVIIHCFAKYQIDEVLVFIKLICNFYV